MTPAERVDRLRLVRTEGVGPVTYRKLLARYRSPSEALAELPRLARNGGRDRLRIPSPGDAERELARLEAIGARPLFVGEPDYPALLGELEAPPPVLSVLGDLSVLNQRCVALVGARNASTNGKRMAELLAHDLALAGLVVVSGMARGVDTAAHEGSMRAGRTVACVAGGVDVAYPEENAALQRQVAEQGGAVVAEAPPGSAPQARHFPRRNRVIAGLSLGVIVVEAAPNSGSLITARMAGEMGRELFAVPGSPLDPRCKGSNDLLRHGATLVESAFDVLPALGHRPQAPAPQVLAEPLAGFEPPSGTGADEVRRRILENLSVEPTEVDDLIRRCQLSASVVVTALLELELGGRLEMLPGNRACLVENF